MNHEQLQDEFYLNFGEYNMMAERRDNEREIRQIQVTRFLINDPKHSAEIRRKRRTELVLDLVTFTPLFIAIIGTLYIVWAGVLA